MTETQDNVRSYAQVTPLTPEWLWLGKIPFGTVTGLFGQEGIAKGFLECALAAIIVKGDKMPDGSPGVDAGSVIMITPEDDSNTTVAYRLRAAGLTSESELAQVADMTEVDGAAFMVPMDVPKLREEIYRRGNVRLVIIDPLAEVASIGLTSSVVKIRQTLINPLIQLARDTGVAVLLTQHTTKDGKTLQGSGAIRQALRQVLMIVREKGNPNIRTISVNKSNIADDSSAGNVHYTLTGDGNGTHVKFLAGDSETAEDVVWHDYSDSELANGQPGWSREAGQTAIVNLLKSESPRTMRAGDIAAQVGLTYIATRVLLMKLSARGEVISTKGDWTVPSEEGNENDA
jgi:AAA domain